MSYGHILSEEELGMHTVTKTMEDITADEKLNMGLRGVRTMSDLIAAEDALRAGKEPAKPKHRLSSTTNYNMEKRFMSEMRSAVSWHVRHLTTHDAMIVDIKARIWDQPMYSRMTQASRARIDGYLSGAMDMIYNHHLTWMMFCDGYLYSRKGIDAIDKVVSGAWSRIDSDRSCHVWTASIDSTDVRQEKLKRYNIKEGHMKAKEEKVL